MADRRCVKCGEWKMYFDGLNLVCDNCGYEEDLDDDDLYDGDDDELIVLEDQEEENETKISEYMNSLTDEELDSITEYEYYKEWILREDYLVDMTLEEFEDMMSIKNDGLTDEELGLDDEE